MSSPDPLHGVTLQVMLTRLVEHYGWQEIGERIRVRCFNVDPSIPSSLKFLRKTPWARDKVEELYLRYHRITARNAERAAAQAAEESQPGVPEPLDGPDDAPDAPVLPDGDAS